MRDPVEERLRSAAAYTGVVYLILMAILLTYGEAWWVRLVAVALLGGLIVFYLWRIFRTWK
jgi:hypothetical protein